MIPAPFHAPALAPADEQRADRRYRCRTCVVDNHGVVGQIELSGSNRHDQRLGHQHSIWPTTPWLSTTQVRHRYRRSARCSCTAQRRRRGTAQGIMTSSAAAVVQLGSFDNTAPFVSSLTVDSTSVFVRYTLVAKRHFDSVQCGRALAAASPPDGSAAASGCDSKRLASCWHGEVAQAFSSALHFAQTAGFLVGDPRDLRLPLGGKSGQDFWLLRWPHGGRNRSTIPLPGPGDSVQSGGSTHGLGEVQPQFGVLYRSLTGGIGQAFFVRHVGQNRLTNVAFVESDRQFRQGLSPGML